MVNKGAGPDRKCLSKQGRGQPRWWGGSPCLGVQSVGGLLCREQAGTQALSQMGRGK